MRLNRFLALCGVSSRREADSHIKAGEVKVNGKVVTEMGLKIEAHEDKVEYRGKVMRPAKFVYILLNKPKNHISTTKDPQGRATVIDAIRYATRERVYPVGRLDRNTTGLLLLTNDGDLAKRLTHPSYKVRKLYRVKLDKEVSEKDMAQLLEGVKLEDGLAHVDKIDYVEDRGMDEVGVEIHIGKNRIVRRLFEALGYRIEALDRVAIAHLTKKKLPRGKWRVLSDKEVSFLKMI